MKVTHEHPDERDRHGIPNQRRYLPDGDFQSSKWFKISISIRRENVVLFVRHDQNTIDEDCAPIADKSVDPKQSNATQGETTKKPGGDIARRRSSPTNVDDVRNDPTT